MADQEAGQDTQEEEKPMKFLSFEEIKIVQDRKVHNVFVKAWGGHVRMREMGGKERDRYETMIAQRTAGPDNKITNMKDVRVTLLRLTLVKEDLTPFMSEPQLNALNAKNGKVINELFDEACRINAIREQDIKEIAGN